MSSVQLDMKSRFKPQYSLGEEIANAVTHGAGTLLSLAGFVLLVALAARTGDPVKVTSYAVFGASLIVLYTMSTIYHSLTAPAVKRVFEILDHSSVYILIAGTYTAFSLGILGGRLGWWIFGIVWACAVVGIALKAFMINRARVLSTIAYVAMGWIAVFALVPLMNAMPRISFVLLLAGGAAYTLGSAFYLMKKVKWTHAIWHLFVLAGSVLHFFSAILSLPAR
jgi:hemolysin III